MAPLTLTHLAGDTWLVPSPANVGIVVTDGRATLIDSGNDEDAGRRLLKLIEAQGWELELIVNTHSNADHVGGNAFLQKRTGCRIAATAIEAAFVEQPWLEPTVLYGGYPMRALRNKFLQAKPSRVTDVIAEEGPVPGSRLSTIALPGHFLGMVGVRTPDDVLFAADSLFSEKIIAKYPLFFLYDVEAHLATLDRLDATPAALYVPSHAEPAGDIGGLVAANRARVLETVELVADACSSGAAFEDVLAAVCDRCAISLDANQYVLVGSTVRSVLSYLVGRGRLAMEFGEGRLAWTPATGPV